MRRAVRIVKKSFEKVVRQTDKDRNTKRMCKTSFNLLTAFTIIKIRKVNNLSVVE
jgi:hypothetical protein